jgi:hypothetical protein
MWSGYIRLKIISFRYSEAQRCCYQTLGYTSKAGGFVPVTYGKICVQMKRGQINTWLFIVQVCSVVVDCHPYLIWKKLVLGDVDVCRDIVLSLSKNLALPSLSVKVTEFDSISRSTELFS